MSIKPHGWNCADKSSQDLRRFTVNILWLGVLG